MSSASPLPDLHRGTALAPLTSMQVGGAAEWYGEARSESELSRMLDWAAAEQLRVTILGGGSNLVVSDDGVAGLVLHIRLRGVEWHAAHSEFEPGSVTASAGEPWDDFVAASVERGLAGIECLSGIPGFVGATPIQNVGAYGQEVSQTIDAVTAWDTETQRSVEIAGSDCGFAYRNSRFKQRDRGRFIVTKVRYRLRPGAPPTIAYPELAAAIESQQPELKQVRETVLRLRARKSMVLSDADPNCRSCGSFFVNPVVSEARFEELARKHDTLPGYPTEAGVKLPAAWLIERAGFPKGTRRGAVGTSSKHSLAIVCHERASAGEVLALAAEIRHGVWQRLGVALDPEPQFLGFSEDELRPLFGNL